MLKYLFILVTFSVNTISAQFIHNYGLKFGLTNSSENWNYTDEWINDFKTDSKIGLNVSGFIEFLDFPFINILTEIGYNQKGMEEKIAIRTTPMGIVEYKNCSNRVDYIEVALIPKLNYETPILRPYIFAGPRLDILLGNDVHPGFKVVYDDFKTTVYGLKFGLGTEIRKELPYSFLVEFRYNYDFSSVYKTDNLKIDNNSFEFKIGIIL